MGLKDYLQSHKKTHLVFDFDETIAYLILPWSLWEKEIKDELLKIDKSIYQDYQEHKISLSLLQNSYIQKNPKTYDLIIKNAINFETKRLQDVLTNTDLIDFIKNAHGYHLFLWSSNTKPTVKRILKKSAILQKFKKIVTRNDVNLLKPDPEGFYRIYDPKIPKVNYLFIGDRSVDQQAAEKVEIDFFKIDFFGNNV